MAKKKIYEEPPIQVLNVYSQGSTYKWNLILALDLWKIQFDLGFFLTKTEVDNFHMPKLDVLPTMI
jgi:hypothetical protein